MRAAARAGVAGVGAAACLAFAAPAAQALVQSAKAAGDGQTTFTINGNSLTVQSSNPIVLEFVRGSTLFAECYPAQTSQVSKRFLVRWGENATSVTFHSPKVLPRVDTCDLVWDKGGAYPMPYATDVAVAPFTAYWRRRLSRTPPPGRFLARALLADEWDAILYWLPARYRNPWPTLASFPAAPALARIVNARFPKAGLRYTPTLAGMTAPGVPYVIGRGSTTKRLELAVIGLDGKRYAYRTKVGPYVGGKFGLV